MRYLRWYEYIKTASKYYSGVPWCNSAQKHDIVYITDIRPRSDTECIKEAPHLALKCEQYSLVVYARLPWPRYQTVIWINAEILSISPQWSYFNEILFDILTFIIKGDAFENVCIMAAFCFGPIINNFLCTAGSLVNINRVPWDYIMTVASCRRVNA